MDFTTFFNHQLSLWPEAARRYDDLKASKSKELDVDGFKCRLQYNPARISSTAARVDTASIKSRPCFLCAENRPMEQTGIDLGDFVLLVNPFPIAPKHFTIAAKEHTPQSVYGQAHRMLRIAGEMPGMVIFYNGPRCGASAPDHLHFQAVEKDFLPIISNIEKRERLPFGVISLRGNDIADDFERLLGKLPKDREEEEPKINLLAWVSESREPWLLIIPRRKHRPSVYGSGAGQMLVSPASIDLGGVWVTPREADFELIDNTMLDKIIREVTYTQTEIDKYVSAKA